MNEFIFLGLVACTAGVVAVRFRKFIREKNEKQLLDEIENDFLEDFSLEKSKLPNSKDEDLKGLIEWVEDAQLEDDIRSKSNKVT